MNEKGSDFGTVEKLDGNALTELFDQYAPILYRYALRLSGNPQEADQIVGDVFSRLIEKLVEGKGPSSNVRAYLFQMAYHAVVDRARERQRTAPLDIVQKFLAEEKALPIIAEEQVLLDKLQVAIENDLTDEQRHVIILRYQEEFSLRETAKIVGKKVNAVKALQNRGVAKLREVLVGGKYAKAQS